MRYCLLLVVVALFVAAAAWAAPCGPLVAGTAPGSGGITSPQHVLGVHYPCRPSDDVSSYGDLTGSYPRPFNGTFPYAEWPDKAMVPGKHAVMSPDIVILSSTRKK
ncbi:MAG: hypothetical protein ABFD94_19540 [Armatimonadia bacterium]